MKSDGGAVAHLLTVPQVAQALALGRAKTYQLVSRGEIASVKIDGSRRIRPADLEAYIAGLTPSRP